MDVEYKFHEGEEATYDYPGSPPEVEVLEIFVGDTNITDLINEIPNGIRLIEETLYEKFI